jgi:transcriptional regulator with XRE-family HTH domain
MRFCIPGLLPDTMSAEQVRAFREVRGWTVEDLADAVRASPLEVSAWEAGAVRVPPEQTERIRWLVELDAWNAKVARVRVEPCEWVRAHVPHLYDAMFADLAGTWDAHTPEVREHVVQCATCRAVYTQAELFDPRPPDPADAPDTWRTRYRRWTKRFPNWIGEPLDLLGGLPKLAILVLIINTVPDADSGFPARVFGVGIGAMMGWYALALVSSWLTEATRRPRVAGVLAGIAGAVVGLGFGSLCDATVDLRDPRLWAGSAVVGVALGLIRARSANEDADPRPSVATKAEDAELGAPRPDLELGIHGKRAAEAVEAER